MYDYLNSIRKVEQKDNLKTTLENSLTEKVDFSKDWEKLSKNMFLMAEPWKDILN